MRKSIAGLVMATAAATILTAGSVHAAPSSVQREDGPCYPQYEHDSADGQLYCSGENGVWTSKALSTAPRVTPGTPCPKLGARAKAKGNHGIVECQRTGHGLRWRNIR